MATGQTPIYDFPYPTNNDPVNVAGDVQDLAERIEFILANAGVPFISVEVTNNSGVTITKGDPVYVTGYNSSTGKPNVAKSDRDDVNTFPMIGLAQGTMTASTDGSIIVSGVFDNINTSSFTAGNTLYVASGGGLTATSGSGAVGIVLEASGTGQILVTGVRGSGTWGSLKAGLA